METQKRRRKQNRKEFTIAANELQKCIDEKEEFEEIEIHFANFIETADSLFKTEEMLRNIWLEAENFDEAAYEEDQENFSVYRKRWVTLKTYYEKIKRGGDSKSSTSFDTKKIYSKKESDNDDEVDKKRRFILPKLELPKFDGNLKNWIQFWGQFRKIHEDSSIDNDDKFQYLLQSMCHDSSARQLVESYPPCGDNYHKAVDSLKNRFARDELLIECYVRGLQNLVLTQARGQNLDIRTLYDRLQTHLQALETLGVTKDKYAAMLFPMVESALPEELLRAWNRNRSNVDNTSTDELSKLLLFLRKEVESEERIEIARSGMIDMSRDVNEARPPTMAFVATAVPIPSANASSHKTEKASGNCIWCDKQTHPSSECHNATKMTMEERINMVKRKKGCLICLKIGHWSKKCRSFPKCLYCKKRHVTLMCSKLSKDAEGNVTTGTSKKEEVLICKKENETLLQTLLVEMFNGENKVTVRALIDSGAQRSFVKKETVRQIGLRPIGKEEMCHGVFGGVKTQTKEHFLYAANIRSIDRKFCTQMTVIEEDDICGDIPKPHKVLTSILKQKGIVLTEVDGNDPKDISLLIGADYCGFLLTGDVIHLDNNITAIKTKLGWTVQGVTRGLGCSINTLFCTSKVEVQDLWSLETMGILDPAEQQKKSKKDEDVWKSFERNIKINKEGRYEVSLPWRDIPRPQTNYELARKRLDSTTKRLQQLNKIEAYDAVFKEWLDMNIIEISKGTNNSGHYLPHHAVIKESSLTTKVRPVFDASARDKYGISLNSCLEKGVNLIELIPQLLIDFRKGVIGVTSDVAKAFLQISLTPNDREYLKFLWWSDPTAENKEVITYRHRRVVFGVTSSPFHLSATIAYHLNNPPLNMTETAIKLNRSFYVDNSVTSVDSVEEMNKFMSESKELMKSALFDLRCWVTAPVRVDESVKTISVLGILWDTIGDNLYCNISSIKGLEKKLTKRNILSTTQKLFDPIGVYCPTTIVPKLIIQKAWLRKLSWDEELPVDLATEFRNWLEHISLIEKIRIPRRLTTLNITECDNTIHVFCDASRFAYAVCIFLRSEHGNNVDVSLVLAKARVTPVKEVTIPRLELIAAVMGVRLCKHAKTALALGELKTYFWTDSSVTLSWIKGNGDWTVFVANRVREIKQFSSIGDWNHIPGHLNPADLPSRGINAKGLLESRWWDGPSWLMLDRECWPATDFTADSTEVSTELKSSIVNTVLINEENFLNRLTYFSSYKKIVRMIGWILRFAKKGQAHSSDLSFEEVERAENALIKLIQKRHSLELSNTKLSVFMDDVGILRLKTKLEQTDENMQYKYPIILPGNNIIVKRLVEERHKILLHAGTQTLIANTREFFWIIGLRRLAKKIINSCIRCKRYKVKACQTPSVSLPLDRVKRGKAFEVTGIDLAGPLLLRCGSKCWIVLFTCSVYRAVHLELVTSLTTDTFIMALRRFVARRGRVSAIYTDNGTNFKGTSNKLNSIDYEQLVAHTSMQKIKWTFIPPGAPWWGGWWERLIGVVKGMLQRILGKASIDYIELETILCDVEAVLNSRPLTYVTGDDENLKPLTPAMFIQPLPTNDVADLNQIDSSGLNIRLKYLHKLREDLQHRFRTEYLATLVQKKQRWSRELCIGDVVLVEGVGKRTNWPLGLVMEVYPGVDGACRVAKVKTANGVKVRPTKKIFPLEFRSPTATDITDSDSNFNRTSTPTARAQVTRSGRVVIPKRFFDE